MEYNPIFDDAPLENDLAEPRFVISVDYGTTYTGVAWILTTGETPTLKDVRPVLSWPGAKTDSKVPSAYTYSANSGSQCWGHGIGKNALVIRLTKLEIEPPSLAKALDVLKRTVSEAEQLDFSMEQNVLVNRVPRHLIRTSEDVMTDYLIEVLNFARRDIEREKDPVTLTQNPIDLVITHPADWAPRARNITFRAVTTAFKTVFSDINYDLDNIRMATESEACAQYIMREALDKRPSTLRPGECFIVVDAGGGTVDLAAYRVDEVSPTFRVTRVGEVSGDRYGSTEVDKCFLNDFLPSRLSPADYETLMTMGGAKDKHGSGSHVVLREGEQLMLNAFLPIKHKFRGKSELDTHEPPSDRLSLPDGIGLVDSPEHGILDRELIITHDDMVKMFNYSVSGSIDLVSKQLIQLEAEGLRVRTIFLSGGFSRNAYYYQCINQLARHYRFALICGSDSWTAVSQGAVLMGLGIGCDVPANNVPCPYHIGVVVSSRFRAYQHSQDQKYMDSFTRDDLARECIHWVVKKDDLITPTEGIQRSVKMVRKFNRLGNKSGIVTIVTSQWDEADEPGRSRHRLVKEGPNAHRTVNLSYDLSTLSKDQIDSLARDVTNPQTNRNYKQVEMTVEIIITPAAARFELVCGKKVDHFGRVAASGHLLAYDTIDF